MSWWFRKNSDEGESEAGQGEYDRSQDIKDTLRVRQDWLPVETTQDIGRQTSMSANQ